MQDEVEETGVGDSTETMNVETTGVDTTNNSTTAHTDAKAGVGSRAHRMRPRRVPYHIWELPVLRYHKIMVIYPYPFSVVITLLLYYIVFINDYICILTGAPI